MPATKQSNLYEVQGKVKDDGRIYDTHICLKCSGLVVYLPDALCGRCGPLTDSEVVKVPETEATEVREAIKARHYEAQFEYVPDAVIVVDELCPKCGAPLIKLREESDVRGCLECGTTYEAQDWGETSQEYKDAQPFHNDIYPFV